MNWSKFAYHSFLTVVLGVTLSVCSNVMETDDFEIEAIASSASTIYGSKTLSSGSNTINFSSSFSSVPVVAGLTRVGSGYDNCTGNTELNPTDIDNLTKSSFTYSYTFPSCAGSGSFKLKYAVIGN
jgi:hypothetical protein